MAIVRLRPADLLRAISEDTLSLQFQPQVHAPTGALVGVEGFVRWPHPAHGMIGPSDIIPLIEQGSFHVEFDGWVLGALCRQIAQWEREGFAVAVAAANLWTQTLRSGSAVELITQAVVSSGARADALEIECPRGTLADPGLRATVKAIRALGVRVASEELGDPALAPAAAEFDTLKIGYPVARDLLVAGSPASAAVANIVAAGRAAGARVVADSVETAMQEDGLLALGCEIVQGYLYGPEVSPHELRLLASAGVRPAAD